MKIIKIIPCKKWGGSWTAFEAPDVEPTYAGPTGKERAISYARNCRFGGGEGEIHVYDVTGKTIIERIPVDGESQFRTPSNLLVCVARAVPAISATCPSPTDLGDD